MAEESCDIYDNLPSFKYDETLEKLQSLVSCLTVQIKELKVKLSETLKEKAELETKCSSLAKNLSSLYKTATAEIQRKDKMLSDLRARLNDNRRNRLRSPPCKRPRLAENTRGTRKSGRSDDSKKHSNSPKDYHREKSKQVSPRIDYKRSNGYERCEDSKKRKDSTERRSNNSREKRLSDKSDEKLIEIERKKDISPKYDKSKKPNSLERNIRKDLEKVAKPHVVQTELLIPNQNEDNQIKSQDKRVPNFNLPNVYTRRMFQKIYGSEEYHNDKASAVPIVPKSDRHLPFAENLKEKHGNLTNETPSHTCPKENKENVKSPTKPRSNFSLNKNRPTWFEESSRESIKFETVVSKSDTVSKTDKIVVKPVKKKELVKSKEIDKKTVEIFGSPVKWVEDSMEPVIDLPSTAYEDSCNAQINVKDKVEFVKPITPNKIVHHSIFSPRSNSRSSFSFSTEKQSDKKTISTRQLNIEDSLIGQFETTTQFISSLTEVEGKISPLGTPSKSSPVKDTKTGLKLKQVINKNGEHEIIYIHSPRKNPRSYNSVANESPKKDSSKCSISESFFHLKEKDLLSLKDKPHKIIKSQQTSNFKRPIHKPETVPKINEIEPVKEPEVKNMPMEWVLYPVETSVYKGRGKWDWDSNKNATLNETATCKENPLTSSSDIKCRSQSTTVNVTLKEPVSKENPLTSSNDIKSQSQHPTVCAKKPGIVISRQRRPNFGRKTIVDNISVKLK